MVSTRSSPAPAAHTTSVPATPAMNRTQDVADTQLPAQTSDSAASTSPTDPSLSKSSTIRDGIQEDASDARLRAWIHWIQSKVVRKRKNQPPRRIEALPHYTLNPMHQEGPHAAALKSTDASGPAGKTLLYLAYGSNMCAETFEGSRGIRPLAAATVLVPDLELVFDLPGFPYSEPRFANTRFRSVQAAARTSEALHEKLDSVATDSLLPVEPDGSGRGALTATKLGWDRGLVGVAYEVTPEEFGLILASEGGGSSYADIEVQAYLLPRNGKAVPADALDTLPRVTAHTLFAKDGGTHRKRDQPGRSSKRYLNLLRRGALEHQLPDDYRSWLADLQPYEPLKRGQILGRRLIYSVFFPIAMLTFSISNRFADDKGRSPWWSAYLTHFIFRIVWSVYDWILRPIFGDGELGPR